MEERRTVFTREACGRPIRFVTHVKPHLDELWSVRMILEHASPDWLAQHAVEGIIKLGVDGAEFDEHPRNGDQRRECCATLVAKSLQLDQDPVFTQILSYLFAADTNFRPRQVDHRVTMMFTFDVYNAVKLLNEQFPNDPERVYAWAEPFMAAKEEEQRDFVASAKEVNAALADKRILTVKDQQGQEKKILLIGGDGRTTVKAAVRILREELAAVIQQKSSGHVQIYTNNRTGVKLREAARLLRMAELRRKGQPSNLDGRLSRQYGVIEQVPEWYYFGIGEMLLNGSHTNPDVPPTQIPLEEIGRCVRLGIEMNFQQQPINRPSPRAEVKQ